MDPVYEFDAERRILHVTAEDPIPVRSVADVDEMFRLLRAKLDEVASEERCYILVNISAFLIDQSLAAVYAEHVAHIHERYAYPHGIVRYGFEMTRITVRMGYEHHLRQSPNLFASRREAMDYIEGLRTGMKEAASAARRQSAEEVS